MEITLDLIVTAVMNIVVLAGGMFYLYWSRSQKKNIDKKHATPAPKASLSRSDEPAPVSAAKQAQPATAVPVSAAKQAARDAVREEASPETDGKEYVGQVKRYSERNGMGFIICSETRSLYDIDIRIWDNEYSKAGLGVGDEVSFQVVVGIRSSSDKRRQHPWATGARRLGAGEIRPEADNKSARKAKSNLDAGASEFLPGPSSHAPTAGRDLSSLIPDVDEPRTATGSPGKLSAAAAEFVPGGAPPALAKSNLRATASEFVPGGGSR